MIANRAVTIGALLGGIISIVVSISQDSEIFAFASAVFFFFSIVVWKYGYVLFPMFSRATNLVEVRGNYQISPSRDHILKKSSGGYFATKFLEVQFYESSRDKDNAGVHHMFESFEKAISSLKYIVKISLMISPLELSNQIDELKTKRSAAESKRSRMGDTSEITKIDREIAYYNRLLDRLTHGERSVEILAFASTTAFGLTKEEAVSRVKRQAKEVQTILSSSLGCDITELKDLDMIRCFEWDSFFPTTQEELKDETF
ncbi:MAG TPA: hypothetical protein VI912_05530 [Candidatus Bilamarchaeaceae archaeon]|nr:hypothetical protein [Candidatus Bilamarchaeaceae archaeon]